MATRNVVRGLGSKGRFNAISTNNIRDVIQRQISSSVESALDQANFGQGDDGYGYQYERIEMRDGQGRPYHLVGINTWDDWSVAGP